LPAHGNGEVPVLGKVHCIVPIDGLYPLRYIFWMWHCQHVLVSTMYILSHAIRVQHMKFSEYLLKRLASVFYLSQ
jgi:hypothetical protein